MQYIETISQKTHRASRQLRQLTGKQKNQFLLVLAEKLRLSEQRILAENAIDLQNGKEQKLSAALLDRLELNPQRIKDLASSVEQIASLDDPVGEVVRGNFLANGVQLITRRVPLGVILVIYESRPNVTIDVGALSFKSGNACILRGGKEAIHSNRILAQIFQESLQQQDLPVDCLNLVDKTDRNLIIPLLKQTKYIDLVVPRGGEGLIQFVSENSEIPVVKHDKGVCNLYIDESADTDKAIQIVINSKTHRPGVCNALENLIIHKEFADSKPLLEALQKAGVKLILDQPFLADFPNAQIAEEKDYSEEFLDYRLSVKQVLSPQEAFDFINQYSSGHTEAIVAENKTVIDRFLSSLDSAALFVNCSTRFHDGGQYGLGAEVGISTGKLHVRGPMGLVHLTTTTTILNGDGQIRQ